MKVIIDLSHITVANLLGEAFSSAKSTDLFRELRRLFAKHVQKAVLNGGLKKVSTTEYLGNNIRSNAVTLSPIPSLYSPREYLDFEFCSGYGVDYYSFGAVNYQHQPYDRLPSLNTFLKRRNFSLGNFGFHVDNGDYEVEVVTHDSVKLVGYSYQIHPRKRKSFIALVGVYFDYEAILVAIDAIKNRPLERRLIDVCLGSVQYPAFFLCTVSGDLFVCNCFKGHIDWKWDFKRFCNVQEQEILTKIENITYLDGICHYCTKRIPNVEIATSGYSGFLRRYSPYYMLECKKKHGSIFHLVKEDTIAVENELRQHFGYPRIGEKWISETHLYYLIKEIYSSHQVLFHYRGDEMEGLELDIFLPGLSLAIEYQGIQHYQAVDHWGGVDGLERRKLGSVDRKFRILEQLHVRKFRYGTS